MKMTAKWNTLRKSYKYNSRYIIDTYVDDDVMYVIILYISKEFSTE